MRSLELAAQPECAFVVMTDIADFFPRLYSHPMENAMQAATTAPDHGRVIGKLVNKWNMSVSYGVPVGPSPFRLISEVTIGDVDQALLAQGLDFCRFSDDYRIFVADERRAREALAFLANVLFRNHGLTLQESKTEIVPAEEFAERFARDERDQERHELQESFSTIADALGLQGEYEAVDYDDLDAEQQALVDSLNLWLIIRKEAEAERALDMPMTRFVLGRIRQLGLRDDEGLLLSNLARFYPVFREVVEALVAQAGLSEPGLKSLGAQLLDLFDHPNVGYLEYHRDWLLTPFVNEAIWNHTDRVARCPLSPLVAASVGWRWRRRGAVGAWVAPRGMARASDFVRTARGLTRELPGELPSPSRVGNPCAPHRGAAQGRGPGCRDGRGGRGVKVERPERSEDERP